MFLLASGVQDNKQERVLLLYQAGSRVHEIFRQITETGTGDGISLHNSPTSGSILQQWKQFVSTHRKDFNPCGSMWKHGMMADAKF